MDDVKFIDAHSHIYELESEVSRYVIDTIVLCVSDDYNSSLATLRLSGKHSGIIPALGVHPWSLEEAPLDEVDKVIRLIESNIGVVRFIGEVGLDKRFKPHTYNIQMSVFKKFLEIARGYDLALNLHTIDAWRDVFKLVYDHDINIAIFHWYTGPTDLIREIVDSGYYISINVAAKIQPKHRRIIKYIPEDNILTETDSPYKYRRLYLTPNLIHEAVDVIAQEKSLDFEETKYIIWRNFRNIISRLNINVRD